MRLRHLIVKFANAFSAELDSTLETLQLGLQVGAFFLRLGHLFFDGRTLLPGLVNLAFAAGDCLSVVVRLALELGNRLFAKLNLVLQVTELMPRKLTLEPLKLAHELLVALGLGGLPLERADLALDLAYGVGNAQQILLGVIELAQCFPLLLLEPGDAGGLLEHHTPVIRFAGDKLGDVPLRHDAVAGAAHAGAHEKLLNVPQSTRNFVDEILAAPVPKNAARDGHLVVRQIHPGRLELLGIDPPDRQRHLGHAQRLALVGAIENDIGHAGTSQCLGRLLPQNPAQCIRHIRFAATVRPHNRRHAWLKIERRLVRERFEAQGREILQIHAAQIRPKNGDRVKPENTRYSMSYSQNHNGLCFYRDNLSHLIHK